MVSLQKVASASAALLLLGLLMPTTLLDLNHQTREQGSQEKARAL